MTAFEDTRDEQTIRDLRAQVAALTVERDELAAMWSTIAVDLGKERDAAIKERDEARAQRDELDALKHAEETPLRRELRLVKAERDQAVARAEAAERERATVIAISEMRQDEILHLRARATKAETQAVAPSTMCDEWQDRFLGAEARATKAEVELANRFNGSNAWQDGYDYGEREMQARATQAEAKLAALTRTLSLIDDWTHQYGASLKPKRADSYGDGMRDAKAEVNRLVVAALAALDKEATP